MVYVYDIEHGGVKKGHITFFFTDALVPFYKVTARACFLINRPNINYVDVNVTAITNTITDMLQYSTITNPIVQIHYFSLIYFSLITTNQNQNQKTDN